MSATVEVRTLPGMTDTQLLADLRAVLDDWNARSGARVEVEFDNAPDHWIEATIVPAVNPVVRSIERVSTEVLGTSVPLSVFPGTTDTSWFAGTGMPSLPAFGPGLLARAHGADEWVSVEAVRTTVDLYRRLIEDFCSQTGETER
jgi:acetylornithine deacetylase/succinyl-diaminopimelate desuccinylase-like protein